MAQRNALAASIGGSVYLNLADLLREQNELDSAMQYAETGAAHSNQEINPGLFISTLHPTFHPQETIQYVASV